jgi:nitrate reductase gamma subunit
MLEFLTGPMLVISLSIFFAGLAVRAALYFKGLDAKLERIAYTLYVSSGLTGAAASIFKWLVPFASRGWRAAVPNAIPFFLLHLGAVLLPFFLLGHTIILEDVTGISLPALPMLLADILTFWAILGLLIYIGRRLMLDYVRFMTTGQDWYLLFITLFVFASGAFARFDASGYDTWLLLHVLSGEILLITAPFTKFSHIILFFCSRAQIGMDFAIKRGGRERGAAFPW